jgi:hypothetical protein
VTAPDAPAIAVAGEDDLPDLLALMRAYCDFYAVGPSDEDLLALSRALIADPEREGLQLVARDAGAQALYDRIGARRSQWLDYDLPVR